MSKKNGAVRFNHRPQSDRPQSVPNGSTVEKVARPPGADVRQDSWVDTPADGAVDGPVSFPVGFVATQNADAK